MKRSQIKAMKAKERWKNSPKKTEADYDHYGKCRTPLKDCPRCRFILGNKPDYPRYTKVDNR